MVEKPLATGSNEVPDDAGSEAVEGPRDVDEDHVNDDTTEGPTADEGKLGLCAPAIPRRVNKEHSVEKEGARNIDGEGRWPWAAARALDAIIYDWVKFIAASAVTAVVLQFKVYTEPPRIRVWRLQKRGLCTTIRGRLSAISPSETGGMLNGRGREARPVGARATRAHLEAEESIVATNPR